MIDIPAEYKALFEFEFQYLDEMIKNSDDIFRYFYTSLQNRVEFKMADPEHLRKGTVIINFLKSVLEADYTESQIAQMQRQAQPETFVPIGQNRLYLEYVLEQMEKLQAQNEAGTFKPLNL